MAAQQMQQLRLARNIRVYHGEGINYIRNCQKSCRVEIDVYVNGTGGCRILINTAENQHTVNKLTTMILIVALVPVITAYGVHVDNNIWMETAEGSFTPHIIKPDRYTGIDWSGPHRMLLFSA